VPHEPTDAEGTEFGDEDEELGALMRNIARTWWLAVPKTISIDATASAP
jgi:hypothetical protein